MIWITVHRNPMLSRGAYFRQDRRRHADGDRERGRYRTLPLKKHPALKTGYVPRFCGSSLSIMYRGRRRPIVYGPRERVVFLGLEGSPRVITADLNARTVPVHWGNARVRSIR